MPVFGDCHGFLYVYFLLVCLAIAEIIRSISSDSVGTDLSARGPNGTNLRPMVTNSLPFKGRVGVGMGLSVVKQPIPILAFPLKGDGSFPRFFGVLESMLIRAASGVFTLKLVPLARGRINSPLQQLLHLRSTILRASL